MILLPFYLGFGLLGVIASQTRLTQLFVLDVVDDFQPPQVKSQESLVGCRGEFRGWISSAVGTLQLRALCRATDPGSVTDLQIQIRELDTANLSQTKVLQNH